MEHEIQELFNTMYSITTEEVEETRTDTNTGTRTVTDAEGNPVLDADGNVQTEEYEYEDEE